MRDGTAYVEASQERSDTRPLSAAAESELVTRIRRGSEAAQEQFVRQYGPQMLLIAKRYFRCPQDAADAVQEAFISAFKSLDSFSSQSRVSTWLHRIAVNACLMKLRAQRCRPSVSIEELLPTFDRTGHHSARVSRWRDDAFEELAAAEMREQIRACIDRLPDAYREVLVLRDIEQYDTDETARLLGESTANVKTRLHRARQALRTLLEPLMMVE